VASGKVHSGQIVAGQVAIAMVAGTAGDPVAVLAAAGLLAGAFLRLRGRWLYQWVGTAAGLAVRRRIAAAGADPAAALALASPGVRLARREVDGRPAVVLADGYLCGAVLDLEPVSTLAGPLLLPGLDRDVQLLLAGLAAPPAADAATRSYRDLTGGEVVTARRVLLVVRAESIGELDAAVRRLRRRLSGARLRPLAPAALGPTLADLAYGPPVREGWSAVSAAGLTQMTYRITPAGGGDLLPRLLALPATVSVDGGAVTVRIAAASPAGAGAADRALRAAVAPASPHRLDGSHLPGVAATLPGLAPRPLAAAVVRPGTAPPAAATAPVRLGPAGLMLGRDREGDPVLAELFRPEGTGVVLIGGLPLAQLLAWRGLGAGARVVVQTARPRAWQPVLRAAAGRPLALVPPAAQVTGHPRQPVLHLVEDGPAAPAPPPGRWCAQVTWREQVGTAEVGLLARARLVLAQPLADRQATLVSATLGLGRAGAELRHADRGLLATIDRGTVGWAHLSPTRVERELVGPLESGGSPPPGPGRAAGTGPGMARSSA
jgi:type VII secretion protein EccE